MTGIPLRGPPTPMKPRLYPQNCQSQHVLTALLKFLEGFLGQRVQRQLGDQTYENKPGADFPGKATTFVVGCGTLCRSAPACVTSLIQKS